VVHSAYRWTVMSVIAPHFLPRAERRIEIPIAVGPKVSLPRLPGTSERTQ